MAEIVEISGNIFDSKCHTLVNTVNCVGVMGKGIAFEFKNRYPDMFSAYQGVCAKRLLEPGKLLLFKDSKPWILNFPTKYHWRNPSKIEYIEMGLQKFSTTYIEKSIESVAFPQLGTSAGGLDWNDVKPIMMRYLEPLENLYVEIYRYDPKVGDSLYREFVSLIQGFTIEDIIKRMNLHKKQAKILYQAITTYNLNSLHDLQNLSGLGDKSIQRIYSYLRQSKFEDAKEPTDSQLILPF